jgi:transcriptional regulator with XRE-family HTH domain
MLPSGPEIRAARALIGASQEKLAAAARINPSTVRHFERTGSATLETVRALMAVLEGAGIEFVDRGVRLK